MAGGIKFISRLRAVRDIGVPYAMEPEDAKYIRLCNLLAFLLIMGAISTLVNNLVHKHAALVVFTAGVTALLFTVLWLNFRRHYTAARTMVIVLWNVALLHSIITNEQIDPPHYPYFITTLAAVVIYPRRETKWMIASLLFSAICYHTALFSRGYYRGLGAEAPARLLYDYTLYVSLVLIALIGRSGSIQAEEQLRESREKVSRLIDRLRVYLPLQLVDAIARGGVEQESQYRRRRLTVFFSDIQGFTAWTDKMEPEEVREILNQYLSEMSRISNRWGGTIDKFIGDALMIFFGDPEFTSDRDHAIRCVKMAVEMRSRIDALKAEWENKGYEDPFQVRIGINTGYATVGNFGSEDRLSYTALGSAVNLASRLESASRPDHITVSHTTYSLIKDEIECEYRGQITVKGFSEPVKIYEVVGLRQQSTEKTKSS